MRLGREEKGGLEWGRLAGVVGVGRDKTIKPSPEQDIRVLFPHMQPDNHSQI